MDFKNEVYEQYLTYSSLGNRLAAKISIFDNNTDLPELCALVGTGKIGGAESLGVMDIPVDKIVGTAGICGKESYTADFLPVEKPSSRFAETWCSIYLDYLNDKKIHPISCYEYLGKFYVIDGKKRVSVMKCNGAPLIAADVIRVLPAKQEEQETIHYYSFLESYKKTGLYQVALCPKYSFEDLQNALGHEKDYEWTKFDRSSMLFRLYSVASALRLSKFGRYSISPVDALMVLFENFSNEEVTKMTAWQMAKYFNHNKEKMFAICPQQAKSAA